MEGQRIMSETFSVTPRQREAFGFIVRYIAAHGAAPSYDDIKAALELRSKSSVNGLVTALVRRGLLKKLGRSQRSLTLVTEPTAALPAHIQARLAVYCTDHDERFEDVLADAVELFLDDRRGDLARQHELDVETAPSAGGGVIDDAA
jgi:SOS-response transcriptional repressor LexA